MIVEVDCRGLSLFVSIVVVERRGNFGTDCSKCGADGTVFRASRCDALLSKNGFYVHVIHFNNSRDPGPHRVTRLATNNFFCTRTETSNNRRFPARS